MKLRKTLALLVTLAMLIPLALVPLAVQANPVGADTLDVLPDTIYIDVYNEVGMSTWFGIRDEIEYLLDEAGVDLTGFSLNTSYHFIMAGTQTIEINLTSWETWETVSSRMIDVNITFTGDFDAADSEHVVNLVNGLDFTRVTTFFPTNYTFADLPAFDVATFLGDGAVTFYASPAWGGGEPGFYSRNYLIYIFKNDVVYARISHGHTQIIGVELPNGDFVGVESITWNDLQVEKLEEALYGLGFSEAFDVIATSFWGDYDGYVTIPFYVGAANNGRTAHIIDNAWFVGEWDNDWNLIGGEWLFDDNWTSTDVVVVNGFAEFTIHTSELRGQSFAIALSGAADNNGGNDNGGTGNGGTDNGGTDNGGADNNNGNNGGTDTDTGDTGTGNNNDSGTTGGADNNNAGTGTGNAGAGAGAGGANPQTGIALPAFAVVAFATSTFGAVTAKKRNKQ